LVGQAGVVGLRLDRLERPGHGVGRAGHGVVGLHALVVGGLRERIPRAHRESQVREGGRPCGRALARAEELGLWSGLEERERLAHELENLGVGQAPVPDGRATDLAHHAGASGRPVEQVHRLGGHVGNRAGDRGGRLRPDEDGSAVLVHGEGERAR
jgi:hypothetical protein